jgi:hypothetical protein
MLWPQPSRLTSEDNAEPSAPRPSECEQDVEYGISMNSLARKLEREGIIACLAKASLSPRGGDRGSIVVDIFSLQAILLHVKQKAKM